MSKPKYLKLLAVVEEDYEPISGEITMIDGIWRCENVASIKLNDDFTPVAPLPLEEFVDLVLKLAKEKSNE